MKRLARNLNASNAPAHARCMPSRAAREVSALVTQSLRICHPFQQLPTFIRAVKNVDLGLGRRSGPTSWLKLICKLTFMKSDVVTVMKVLETLS
jgi:hypothetical protein